MGYQLYGFLIGDDIQLDIDSGRLFRFSLSWDEKRFSFSAISLNDTMMQLFLYLLNHARGKSVSRDELFKNIWEKNNLTPSSQRLWQVTSKLNKQLIQLGLPNDFIKNIKGKGYVINHDKILPLYFNVGDIVVQPEQKSISCRSERYDRYAIYHSAFTTGG
ncbi:TPA: transcriptional regulator [Serratia fonticola]